MRFFTTSLLVCLAGSLTAQTKIFDIEITGVQEAPPSPTMGSGQASVFLNTATGAVNVRATYTNLSSNVMAAHIHGPARRGRNANVVVGLSVSGGTSGTVSGGGTLTPAQMQDLLDGLYYVNIHTANFSGGEIRGQIDTVPGSGHPGAPLMSVSGAAAPGGTLVVNCPPGIGTHFVVLGLPLPPCQVAVLPPPIACAPGPANAAINQAGPIFASLGAGSLISFPASFPTPLDIAIHCVLVTPTPCLTLSVANRIAIRP